MVEKGGMSVFFSTLLFLRLVFGCAEIVEKQGTAGNPQQDGKGSEERAGDSKQHPFNDGAKVVSAVVTSGPESAQDSTEKKSEEMHSQDARIQNSAKNAAWSMFWVAVFQFVVSVLGIAFIWATLKETRRSVDEASKSSAAAILAVEKMEHVGDESVRPWISVKCNLDGNFSGPWQDESGQDAFLINIECEVENHGCSPATNVIWKAGIGIRSSIEKNLSMMDALCKEMKTSPQKEAQAIFPGQKSSMRSGVALPQSEIDACEGSFISLFIYGCIQYKSQHFTGVRQTRFAFVVVNPNGSIAAILIKPDLGLNLDTLGGLNLNLLKLSETPQVSAD